MTKENILRFVQLVIYWSIPLILGAFAVACITFYSALDNFGDYGFKNLLKYEHAYLYLTFKTLFLLSGLFSFPAFIINSLVYLREFKNRILTLLIINIAFLTAYSFFLDLSRILMKNTAYYLVLPVYAIILILAGFILKTRND